MYSSTDLYNWKDEGVAMEKGDIEIVVSLRRRPLLPRRTRGGGERLPDWSLRAAGPLPPQRARVARHRHVPGPGNEKGILGTLLLASYFGGAIATHLQHQQGIAFPIAIEAVVWVAAVLRFPELSGRILAQGPV